MTPKPDAERVNEIFENALDLASSEQRRGYVEGVCDGHAALLARVQTLLRVHFESSDTVLPASPREFTAAPMRRYLPRTACPSTAARLIRRLA
jgi:hypothetical protein